MTILLTGWFQIDAIVSVLIALLVLGSSWSILRDATTILLEAAPRGIDTRGVGERLAAAPGVVEVHDLHIWTITSGFPALSAHVLVGRGEDCHGRRRELEQLLQREFGIEHTTLQVDHTGDASSLVELGRFDESGSSVSQWSCVRSPTDDSLRPISSRSGRSTEPSGIDTIYVQHGSRLEELGGDWSATPWTAKAMASTRSLISVPSVRGISLEERSRSARSVPSASSASDWSSRTYAPASRSSRSST